MGSYNKNELNDWLLENSTPSILTFEHYTECIVLGQDEKPDLVTPM